MQNGISAADLIGGLAPYRNQIAAGLVAFPIGGALLGKALIGVRERTGAWFLSIVVHAAVFMIIPPLLVLGYLALGAGMNLFTEVDVVFFFGPLLSGIATLFVVPQIMALDDIPGFDRLRGLMGLVALSFGVVFFLSRTHYSVWFLVRPGLGSLLMIAVVLFLLFKLCLSMITRPGRVDELDMDLDIDLD